MTKKPPKDTKVGGIKSTRETHEVDPTREVGGVHGIKPTAGVSGVSRAGAVGSARRPTRTMTLAEREELFRMINEEADKMFGEAGIPEAKRELVETAVKMAVDSGLLDVDDKGSPGSKPPPADPSKKKKLV